MKHLLLTLLTLLISTQIINAQEIELYNSVDDAEISLKADPDAIGADALLYLHRSDGLGKSQIRFDLNGQESGRENTQLTNDFWDIGIKSGHRFQLELYTSSENIDGSINAEVRSAIVVDQARGREEAFEVEIPQGILRIGQNLTIREEEDQTYIETGSQQDLTIAVGDKLDIVSDYVEIDAIRVKLPGLFSDNTATYSPGNATLGTSCDPWPEIWGDHYLISFEECGRSPNWDGWGWSALKSNNSILDRLMGVVTLQGVTDKDEPVINIEPTSFAERFPEAAYKENVIADDESGEVIEKTIGMKINVLLPILLKSIQEQQEMITDLQAQIDAID